MAFLLGLCISQKVDCEAVAESLVDPKVWAYCQSVKASDDLFKKISNFPLHDVVARCKKDHGYDDADMVLLERELKRYLYLCVLPDVKKEQLGMFSTHVDNLWHAFVLHTPEYHVFGDLVKGRYIHHIPIRDCDQPKTSEQRNKTAQNYKAFIELYEKTFNAQADPIWLLDVLEQGLEREARELSEPLMSVKKAKE